MNHQKGSSFGEQEEARLLEWLQKDRCSDVGQEEERGEAGSRHKYWWRTMKRCFLGSEIT